MKKFCNRLALALALTLLSTIAGAAQLIVSAAASLTNAFAEIGREYEAVHPGEKILLNFAGSGQLLQQIARGAPVDVFASADEETMDRASERNLIDRASRVDFTRNSLTVIAPVDSTIALRSLADLKKPFVQRIAISNPGSVPVGRYSRQVLERAGLWRTLESKFINTQHVRQSLDYVARGEVDAGFVYSTDAAIMPYKVKILFEVPTPTAIRYPIAVVAGSSNRAEAIRFIDFVRSERGEKILAKYGFRSP